MFPLNNNDDDDDDDDDDSLTCLPALLLSDTQFPVIDWF